MAERPAKCPKCGGTVRKLDSVDDKVFCLGCGGEFEPYLMADDEPDPRQDLPALALHELGLMHPDGMTVDTLHESLLQKHPKLREDPRNTQRRKLVKGLVEARKAGKVSGAVPVGFVIRRRGLDDLRKKGDG